VADGMCDIGIGSDTGGSTRMPAAFCGFVGYKRANSASRPTARSAVVQPRFHRPVAKTVARAPRRTLCSRARIPDAGSAPLQACGSASRRVFCCAISTTPWRTLRRATNAAGKAGIRLSDETITEFDEVARVQAKASFSSVEAYAIHRQWLTTRAADYDRT